MKALLCIGGPLNGKRMTWPEVRAADEIANYVQYNRYCGGRTKNTAVFIHKDLLPEPEKKRATES